jgi:hypothetical protein
MHHYHEVNSSVGGSACSYARLSEYYGPNGLQLPMAATLKGQVANTYVVPVFGSSGYNALVHSPNSFGGYPNINAAYKSDGNCFPVYHRMNCNGKY